MFTKIYFELVPMIGGTIHQFPDDTLRICDSTQEGTTACKVIGKLRIKLENLEKLNAEKIFLKDLITIKDNFAFIEIASSDSEDGNPNFSDSFLKRFVENDTPIEEAAILWEYQEEFGVWLPLIHNGLVVIYPVTRIPAVGEQIFVHSSISISNGSSDTQGGLTSIRSVECSDHLPLEHINHVMVKVENIPNHSYNYRGLLDRQLDLMIELQDKIAAPDPDVDRPWVEDGDVLNGKIYHGNPIP